MPKVVPSQVVAVIDQVFPDARTNPDIPVYSGNTGTLSAIVTLTDEIPEELITISGQDYTDLIQGLAALTQAVIKWNQRGGDAPPAKIAGKSPLFIIREMLAKCPDQPKRCLQTGKRCFTNRGRLFGVDVCS